MVRKLRLILRFYGATMCIPCVAVSVALAVAAANYGPVVVPWCLAGKAAIYPLYLYLWIVPRYAGEFYYYRNLGIRRRALLGVGCAVDFALCYVLLRFAARFLYETPA